jgi:hypothetical protein
MSADYKDEFDFKMYIIEDAETGLPLITMQVAGIESMEEAEELANELFGIITGEPQGELH